MTSEHKKGISLLAQMLLRARVEKEMREREQLALYGGLAGAGEEQKGLKVQTGQSDITQGTVGRFHIFLRLMMVYPEDTFRAIWDLIITL